MTSKNINNSFRFKLTRHRSYIQSDRYFADLVVMDMEYDLGPYYLTLLESMQIDVSIRTTIRRVRDTNPGRFLKRQLSERKAELRLSGTSISGNEYLKKQISDLEKMLYEYESDGVIPANVSFIFRVFADHPATLNENLSRIIDDLGMLGIKVEKIPSSKRSVLGFFSPNSERRYNYLMNTRHIASLLPVYRDPQNSGEGIILGVDDLTEKFVKFNTFGQNSYNILVVGETGSGKSYFGKIFLARNQQAGLVDKSIVFDPLNEYFCKSFQTSCKEVDVQEYVTEYSGNHRKTYDQKEGELPKLLIVKAEPEELENEDLIYGFLKGINVEMTVNPDAHKLLIIDECHIILRNQRNAKALGQMVRHSRHYNTAIVNISQNTDDFLNERTNSIAFNSNRIFVFRTRNLKNSHKKVLKLDDFDIDPPERLMGGKIHPYSECLMTDGEYCRKLRILSTDTEDRELQRF